MAGKLCLAFARDLAKLGRAHPYRDVVKRTFDYRDTQCRIAGETSAALYTLYYLGKYTKPDEDCPECEVGVVLVLTGLAGAVGYCIGPYWIFGMAAWRFGRSHNQVRK